MKGGKKDRRKGGTRVEWKARSERRKEGKKKKAAGRKEEIRKQGRK